MAENVRINKWMDDWAFLLPVKAKEQLAEVVDEIDTLAQNAAGISLKLAGEKMELQKRLDRSTECINELRKGLAE